MSLVTLPQAIDLLRAGDVVALPTETVYGLCARIDSEAALLKIFSVKQRPSFDPLIVHVSSVMQARALCAEWPALYDALTEEFWPGPLTLIAPK
ncbi:MAG: L-threonylcarbamoyladenylate synthase, partial [Bdellovibrionales bacterium]